MTVDDANDRGRRTKDQGPLLILSGPSGVGKSTVVEQWLAVTKFPLRRAVTATTRQPRPGERPEIDYHFWTCEQFQERLNRDEMLEHAVVHGTDFYGTPRSEVDPYRAVGTGVILVIDVQGAAQVRAKYPGDAWSVFLDPPSFEELRERLQGRGSEDAAKVARRLQTAQDELARADEFDTRLVNGNLGETVAKLEQMICERFPAFHGGS